MQKESSKDPASTTNTTTTATATTAGKSPETGAVKMEMGTKIWTCPRCNGAGGRGCGDPHCGTWIPCSRCHSGKITDLEGLREAVCISDLSALELILQEQQSQCDLDWALGSAIRSRYPQHVRLLLAADADRQEGLKECLNDTLLKHRLKLIQPMKEQFSILRLLVDSGVTVGDEEIQRFDDALKCAERNASETKQELEVFRDILMSARPKILSLSVDEVSPDSWLINVHMMDGHCVATVDGVPSSMTLGELKTEIQLQASIPRGRQLLIVGGETIDCADWRASLKESESIGELLRKNPGASQQSQLQSQSQLLHVAMCPED